MRNVICSCLVLGATSALGACGTSNGNTPGTGPATDGHAEAGRGASVDASSMGCADAGSITLSASAAPVGQRLASGDNLSVRGVTSDGYLIYSDDAALHLYAIMLPAGATGDPAAPEDLGSLGGKFWISLVANVVFVWSDVNDDDVGTLSVWTSGTGLRQLSSASLGLIAAASPDATQVMYVDGVDSTGTTGDVSIAGVDGSEAAQLVSGAYVKGCLPQLGFLEDYAVASHCEAAPSGAPSSTISSFSLPAVQRVDLVAQAANYWSASATTQEILFSTAQGVMVAPVGGGHAMTIDSTGFIGQLSSDGKTAFYSTVPHGFRRSEVAAPSPMTLVEDQFGGLYTMSNDDTWALYYWTMGSGGSDLYLASATTSATPETLSALTTAGIAGDGFTSDSSHAVYLTNINPCTGSGTLNALAVSSAVPVVLAQSSWSAWATVEANMVFTDHFVAAGGLRIGRADVEFVNTASTAPPTLVVEQADAVLGLSPAGDEVVYSWSARPGSDLGIYVASLPQ